MAKKDYTLENYDEFGVKIKRFSGYDYYNNPIYERIIVNVNFDHSTLKIQSFRGIEDWTYCLQRFENDTIANWQSRDNAIRYVGENAIIEAEKQVKRNIAAMKKELKNAKNNPVFLMLKPIADKLIKSYKSDFEYHDCLTLYRDNPNKFLWFVRETGSWLVDHKSNGTRDIVTYSIKNEPHKIYWYNGITVKELDNAYEEVMNLFNKLPVME